MTNNRSEDKREYPTVAEFLGTFSAEDFKEWFLRGFRAMAADDVEKKPFGIVRSAYPKAEDISDVLAEAYFDLQRARPIDESNDPFAMGLEAAFRSLSARNERDRRSLIDVLRLAAKISYTRLLPHIAAKLFPAGEQPSESEKKLRSVALDVAIEFSSQSPNAAASLQDIIQSNLFRPSAARTILLALCSAEPHDLLDHLFRLEAPLVGIFGDSTAAADGALWQRRAMLLADILRFSPPSVVFAVIEYCLRNRYWRLAWLGKVLLEPRRWDNLTAADAERLRKQYNELPGRRVIGSPPVPGWVQSPSVSTPTLEENRRGTEILTDDDAEPKEEEEVRLSVIARLARGGTRPDDIDPLFRTQILNDSEFKDAA
jgi:hypothetical protein